MTRVRYDPRMHQPNSDWLAHPYPSDHRMIGSGVDLGDFPNPAASEMVDFYLFEAEDILDGFGLNTPIYFSFDGPIDISSIPENPENFLEKDAPFQLVDIDPSSPELGRRFPLRWTYLEEGDSFRAPHTLIFAPHWGFPLRSSTSYAALITRNLLDRDGVPVAPDTLTGLTLNMDDRCIPDFRESIITATAERLLPLRNLLETEKTDLNHAVSATVFTTLDATGEVKAMREIIHEIAPPSVTDWTIFSSGRSWHERSFRWSLWDTAEYYVLEGHYNAPYFLEGTIPYYSHSDGGYIKTENGRPAISEMESLRFALSVPKDPPSGGACYPLVQYAHGTGGQAHHFTFSTGGRLAGRGLAGIGIDQPLHGTRNDGQNFDVSLLTFNVNNIHSTRSLFRQSAADTFSLTRMIKNGFEVPADISPTGNPICFITDPLLFFGHSQGGITGSIAATFEKDIDAWMLSGAGGGVGITLVERKDPIDIAYMLAHLGGMAEDETLDEFHPLVMLLHTITEVTDPINYSPQWLDREKSRHFLVTSGTEDTATPYKTALAKTVAAGIPLVHPTGTLPPWHELAGIRTTYDPVSGNISDSTAAHIHWPEGDHFVVFQLPEAIHASIHFLKTAAWGLPTIERKPNEPVR